MRTGGLGTIIAIILSFVLGFRGLYRLILMQRYTRFLIYSIFWFGFPMFATIFFYRIGELDPERKMWAGIPLFLTGFCWAFFGLHINKKVENIKYNKNYQDDKSKIRRIVGAIMVTVSIVAWFMGYNYYLMIFDGSEIILPFICSILFFCGFVYLITGNPFNEVDS